MKNGLQRAKEIISKIQYATIATVTEEGLPWNSPVFTAYDKDYNFYWGTHCDSQKAKNIRVNSNVFLVIYDSTAPSGAGEGVYITAIVQELNDPDEKARAFELLKSRHDVPFWDFAAIQDGPIRLYKAAPQQVWMNDAGEKDGHYIDIRTEIRL